METLAHKCRGEWAAQGLAAILKPEVGGKPCWHVREDADAGKFARIKSPGCLPIDRGKLTEAQRQTVRARKKMLDEWSDTVAELLTGGATEREATAVFLRGLAEEQGGGISRETLYRWMKSWRAAGWAGLVDGRRDRGGDREGEQFIEELKRLYLSPRQRGAKLCYDMASDRAEEEGWAIPFGPRRAQQVLQALDPKVVAFHRLGPKVYDGNFGKHIQRDYSNLATNDLWVSDGHDFNVFVVYKGKLIRPVLVSWMDVKSRFIVGWRIIAGAENSDAIRSALKLAIREHGTPLTAYHDNGRSYDARSLQGDRKRPQLDLGVFERLDIRVRHARPFNAKAKVIERFHRTLDERFSKRFDTYCGGDTGRKPFDLEEQKAAGKALTLEEFIASFTDWLAADYHNKAHGGEGMEGKTPAQVYRDHLGQKRIVPADVLDLELCRRELATVGRNGVTIRGITYEAPELDSRGGQELPVLVDDENIGQVKVLDAAGRFLCVASSSRKVPANTTSEDLREAMAEINRDRKRVKAALPAHMRAADDPIERMHRQAEAKRQAAPKPEPSSIKPFRSNLEADAAAIRQAEQDARRRPEGPQISFGSLYGASEEKGQGKESYPRLADLYPRKEVG